MKAPFRLLAGLLRLVGILLKGTANRVPDRGCADGFGYPNVAKLRSTHVDPYRTGNYFAWTRRDE